MGSKARQTAGVGLVVCVCLMAAATARAQGVGAIGGTLTDSSGALLPGVTVTLESVGGSIGGNQQTVTNERGTYQFTRLVPGRYSVKASCRDSGPPARRT